MNYKTRIMSLAVFPEGKHIFDEDATVISIDDEGGGEFILLKQDDTDGEHFIRINTAEWPFVCAAVQKMMDDMIRNGNSQKRNTLSEDSTNQ